jgi:hypothetical protein
MDHANSIEKCALSVHFAVILESKWNILNLLSDFADFAQLSPLTIIAVETPQLLSEVVQLPQVKLATR